MSERGTCAACDRPDLTLLTKDRLCGRCYRAKGDSLIYWSNDHEMWVAKIMAQAERLGVPWEGDPALQEPELAMPTDREIDEARHGIPQEEPEPKPCAHCSCPGPCPQAEVTDFPERSVHPIISEVARMVDDALLSAANARTEMSIGDMILTRHTFSRRETNNPPFAAVRINSKGMELALSAVAVTEFGIASAEFVDVFSDTESKVLALVPLESPTDDGSIKLRRQDGNTRVLSATSVLRDVGISESGRYKVRQEVKVMGFENVLVIDFKERAA